MTEEKEKELRELLRLRAAHTFEEGRVASLYHIAQSETNLCAFGEKDNTHNILGLHKVERDLFQQFQDARSRRENTSDLIESFLKENSDE